jgi:putative transcriptional regulator
MNLSKQTFAKMMDMNTPDSFDRPINLTHHFLIAMPSLTDDTFSKSVVYMCEHSERGALGLVINKPSSMSMKALFEKVDLPLGREDLSATPVFQGGPVHTERGFVLHEAQSMGDKSHPTLDASASLAAADSALVNPLMLDSEIPREVATESPLQETHPAALNESPDPPDALTPQSIYASTLTIPGGLEMTTSRDVLEALSTGAGPRRVLISLGYAAWAQGQLESEIAENSWLTVDADPDVIFDTPIEKRYDKALSLLGLESWMISPGAGHA